MNKAKRIIKTLYEKKIFGYPGGAIMPLYDALFKSSIQHILCRHEQGAIFSAIGYARSSGNIGACFVTSGPGVTNIITGLADALFDSVPLIIITGQVNSDLIGTHAFQEIDTIGLTLSCTKYNILVKQYHNLKKIILQSIDIALHGRPGPVLIDIPKNIQLQKEKDEFNSQKVNLVTVVTKKKFVNSAVSLIKKSQKPILYVGGGVEIANAVLDLRKMINITNIPTVVTLKGIGSPDYTHKYYLGMIGMHGNKIANLAIQECDLLIAIGSRFDDRATGNIKKFAPHAKIIHIDIDKSEFNRQKKSNICLLGNVKFFLKQISVIVNINEWHKKIIKLKKLYSLNYKKTYNKINPSYFLNKISQKISKNYIITTDVGQHQMWAAQHINIHFSRSFICSSGLGAMGFGLPAAIGAKIACPKKTVICISGDGSFMMNVQELSTIKRYNLSIKIILLDNNNLGMVRQWQSFFFKKRFSETDLKGNPNFIKLANSFGISSMSISNFSQIKSSIKIFLQSKKSFLLHVLIDKNENVLPLVSPGESNDVMIENFS